MNKQKDSRREFLKKSALAAAAFSIVPRSAIGGQDYFTPYIKINFDNDASVVGVNSSEVAKITDGYAITTGNGAFQSFFVTPHNKIRVASLGVKLKFRFKIVPKEDGAVCRYFALKLFDESGEAVQGATVMTNPIKNDVWHEGEMSIVRGNVETGKRTLQVGDYIAMFKVDARNTSGKSMTLYLDYLETIEGESPTWAVPSQGLAEIRKINEAVNNASPGATIIIPDGTYSNIHMNFTSAGTAGNPITIKTKTPGGVIINGNSSLTVLGSHLVIDGLFFHNGYASPRVIHFTNQSKKCRLTNIAIINVNDDSKKDTDIRWIQVHGSGHEVDHCFLRHKTTLGLMLDCIGNDFHIHNNYFGYFEEAVGNGGEALRVRGADNMSDGMYAQSIGAKYRPRSDARVEYNFFDRCDGESELISGKGNGNIFRYNNFNDCLGALTLRYSVDNLIEGNLFFGGRQSRLPTALRIMGEDTIVKNNYFFNTGDDNPAIYMEATNCEGDKHIDYSPLENAVISNNSFINCNTSMWFDYLYGKKIHNRKCSNKGLIFNNLFHSTVGQSTMFREARNTNDFQWKDNIAFGKTLGLKVIPNGLKVGDPKLIKYNDILYFPNATGYGADKTEILKVPRKPEQLYPDGNWIKKQIVSAQLEPFALNGFKFNTLSSDFIHNNTTVPELASNAIWRVSIDIAAFKVGRNRAYRYTHLHYIDRNDPQAVSVKINNVISVPLSFIETIMGAGVTVNQASQKITIKSLRNRTIEFTVGSKAMTVNSRTVKLDWPSFNHDGRIYIPIGQFIKEMGYIVSVDDRDIVLITPFQSVINEIKQNTAHLDKIEEWTQ